MAGLGATEPLIVLAVLLPLFGSAKPPHLARSLGRSARILRTEVDQMNADPEPAAPPHLTVAPDGPATARRDERAG